MKHHQVIVAKSANQNFKEAENPISTSLKILSYLIKPIRLVSLKSPASKV